MIDALGHLGYALLVVGSVLVGRGMATGWSIRLLGSGLWLVLGMQLGLSSVWAWSGVFAIIDFLNWRKWNAALSESKNDPA